MASVFVMLARLLIPFTIFKWPLGGAILSIIADASDVMIFQVTGYGYFDYFGPNTYHNLDKFFDIYYLFFEFLVARRWANMFARRTATFFFGLRFAGIVLFEITKIRWILVIAPNIFENFYIFWTVALKWFKNFKLETYSRLFIILFIVGAPKIAQEYLMHYVYVDQTWNFIRDNLFWWVYR
ncbi:MAG: hypothetical protein HYT34_00460 [Candidatus Ryanbacteria bacterium]|nr:hypothetical protein [Candidatus Ryanbacteria bacterium]